MIKILHNLSSLFRNLWTYRPLILANFKRELAVIYQGTLAGRAWLILQPLMMIVIYTLVFSQVMHARLGGSAGVFSYSIFLCAGLIHWNLFSDLIQRFQACFVNNAALIKKLFLPKSCLFAVALMVSMVNYLIMWALFLLFLVLTSNLDWLRFWLFIPAMLLQNVMAISMGVFLATASVFFKDVSHLVGMLLQLAFWLTPVVYPLDAIPDFAQKILYFNPMTSIVRFQQQLFLSQPLPELQNLIVPAVWTLVFALLSVRVFSANSSRINDEI